MKAYNSSIWEAEAGGSRVGGKSRLKICKKKKGFGQYGA
jgi:hypothetical protein